MHFSGFPESLKSQILATMVPPPDILGLLQTSRFKLLGGWNVSQWKNKVTEVNDCLISMCRDENISFINHTNN